MSEKSSNTLISALNSDSIAENHLRILKSRLGKT